MDFQDVDPSSRPSNAKFLWITAQQGINKEIQMMKYGWIVHTIRRKNSRKERIVKTEAQVFYTSLKSNPQGKRHPGAP